MSSGEKGAEVLHEGNSEVILFLFGTPWLIWYPMRNLLKDVSRISDFQRIFWFPVKHESQFLSISSWPIFVCWRSGVGPWRLEFEGTESCSGSHGTGEMDCPGRYATGGSSFFQLRKLAESGDWPFWLRPLTSSSGEECPAWPPMWNPFQT